MGVAGIPGIQCKGDFTDPQTIHCGFVSQDTQAWIQGDAAVPKELDIGGDAATVGLACDARPVVLATGKGDWTQADFVQTYEMDTSGRAAAVLTGSPVAFAGPVIALWSTGTSGVARAVVRDLKSGNYEAWVVTARLRVVKCAGGAQVACRNGEHMLRIKLRSGTRFARTFYVAVEAPTP